MELATRIEGYIEQPFPIWNSNLTRELVNGRWKYLRNENLWDLNQYNTAGYILKDPSLSFNRTPITCKSKPYTIYMEIPSFEYLTNFYKENGLNPYTGRELEKICASEKLSCALDMINLVSPAYACVLNLVRAIQVIKSHNVKTDASYSHPDIPFSIFVSVCHDSSEYSNLRVAESILHEAMHLKLSLIESDVQLIKRGSVNKYFSPWRDEKRLAGGVLHGLYVFRAIFEFFRDLTSTPNSHYIKQYARNRQRLIIQDIKLIRNFANCSDLTEYGSILAGHLINSN